MAWLKRLVKKLSIKCPKDGSLLELKDKEQKLSMCPQCGFLRIGLPDE